jgi:hypothetical protein
MVQEELMRMAYVPAALLTAAAMSWGASCSSTTPESVCTSWVEETCEVAAKCCSGGEKFDLQACRRSMSKSCLHDDVVEMVHAGAVVFDKGASVTCLGTATCADLGTPTGQGGLGALGILADFERVAACGRAVSGFRPLGSACTRGYECETAGEYSTCYHGVCAAVVLDETECSFSFDTFELRTCRDATYCDRSGFEPNPTDPPSERDAEFKGSCKPHVASGKSCVRVTSGAPEGFVTLPCADGLFCDVTLNGTTPQGVCTPRKAKGATCSNHLLECKDGLECQSQGTGTGTCGTIERDYSFCYTPIVCGNGTCEEGESSTCPIDCVDTACGDGVCSDAELANDSCPDDCGP